MTTAECLIVLRRRWYLALGGLVVTAFLTFLLVGRPGVYTSRVDVALVAPRSAEQVTDTTLVDQSESLIATAGLVERLVNANTETSAATSQEVSLASTGVRDGTLVKLPNSGGQWDYNFTAPMLSVQVVGPDADEVLVHRESAVRDIKRELRRIQVGTDPDQRITTQEIPVQAPVTYVTGHVSRVVVGGLLTGGLLTLALTILIDHRLTLRRQRRVHARASASVA
ncbi:hypothetical protein ncot_15590 [Nocardioides sp. JQ2195]|uniref:hypothetical protein n=1 Tax=Nocardioides sp. JQ2195 TaxID=2592334 RepID=UPI00143E40B7|nr:hypothetical protein [Nocardioides sp. JQ2195]QIX27853.1 hypothetical protein ncot_15590 [Nocardioides sp. JQ2195]